MQEYFIQAFQKELNKLKEEINLYKDEKRIWLIDKNIANSSGNLALHLVGNLNHFIGSILGNSGYVRTREAEFSDKNIPINILINKIEETEKIVSSTLKNLTDDDLNKIFPVELSHGKLSTKNFLIFLISHFNYHLGQINYHRRLLD